MSKTLREQLGKKGRFESPHEEAHLNIVRTGAVLGERVVELFKSHGLSDSAYNALRILRGAHPGARKHCEIGREMVVRVPDVTRLIDRLERENLVERERSAEDRRVVFVRITAQGLERLGAIDGPLGTLHRELLGHMSVRDLRALSAMLERARAPWDGGEEGKRRRDGEIERRSVKAFGHTGKKTRKARRNV